MSQQDIKQVDVEFEKSRIVGKAYLDACQETGLSTRGSIALLITMLTSYISMIEPDDEERRRRLAAHTALAIESCTAQNFFTGGQPKDVH